MIRIIELTVNGVFAVAGLALLIIALRYPRVAFIEIPSAIFRTFLNVVRQMFLIDRLSDMLDALVKTKASRHKKASAARA
ncbi:hypothetical protein WBG78_03785 [Chryseolinea sp. T2]|uniref:hypothetical protein n=1 Tax=Chryseolinea sp. T2 TaxID=3129255 RepID=UPI0030788AB5